MGKIIVSESVSLDGVMQDPTDGDTSFAGWFNQLTGKDREAWAEVQFEEALGAEAMLLGRRTYEWLVAKGWPTRTGGWADRLTGLPKYVVSSTLRELGWDNTTVLSGDVVDDVTKLRDAVAGDIVVNGSGQLVHTLLEHDIVDELRLMICPFVLGAGDGVFDRTGHRQTMRLMDTRTVGAGLVRLTYGAGSSDR
ncbi:MAG TPA: dihydrofolate reductase family protein [Pseudonocardiaceae bacterium]|nr:dihydrofolate reductase family protein [Pseudonocardiaceae bacterium]